MLRLLLLEQCKFGPSYNSCSKQERLKNRAAIKSLIHCIHFLARHHIAHKTNFSDLVDFVVSCGGEYLRFFIERAGRNAAYTSKDAVVEFVAA